MLAEKPSERAERSWGENKARRCEAKSNLWKTKQKFVQCSTILPEVTKKIEDDVKRFRSKRTKQRRAKCRWKLDQVAILDYRRYRRRLIRHQTSRKICTSGDLETRDVARAWETCQATCHFAPSSIFISFLNIVARSLIFIVNVVVGIPLGNACRLQHLQRGYSKQQQTFRNRFPGINWIYPSASSSSSSNSHLLANTHTHTYTTTQSHWKYIHRNTFTQTKH